MRAAILLAALLACAPAATSAAATSSPAAPAAPVAAGLTPGQRAEVIGRLARLLDARYLDPATGRLYARRLRERLAARAYDDLVDPAAFGRAVSADLQAVAPDRHLRVAPLAAFARPAIPADTPLSARPSGDKALEEARMIGDVAYLRFNMLPQAPETAAAARAFLLAHADAKAIVIDARPLRGGGDTVMNAILPLFYAEPTTLVRMDMRGAEPGGPPGPALVPQPAPRGLSRLDHRIEPDLVETRLRTTPLYYLTSRRTASAGEHLALALKRTGRGVLIGETTAGAGHFGWIEPLPHGLGVFLPVGRTYDPDTGIGWEGRGVTPDIATPADAALDEALARIARADPGRPPSIADQRNTR